MHLHSPLKIDFILHCHHSPNPFPNLHYPAQRECVAWAKRENLIMATEDLLVFELSPRGQLFLHSILNTKLPE